LKCIDAYKNLNIAFNNGDLAISPCCISPRQKINSLDFDRDSYLNGIRRSWDLNQFPAACNACETAELNGTHSRRQGSNQWYIDNNVDNLKVELLRLDYWTGDTCNLRCAICGPYNSSAWKQELKIPEELQKSKINYFWRELDLLKIKFVHFNGGEPLLSKEHVLFLEEIPNKKLVHINYNTNATILPSEKLLKLWKQFKLVQLDFSIDDINERFEYQRYPAKWSEIIKNLQWFISNSPDNCMFAVNTSVGILNHSNMENLNNWLKNNFFTSRFSDPVEHRQQMTVGLFSLKDAIKNKKSIVEFLDACDNRRGTNWKLVFPELVNTLKN
jgi:sulfatase maturation enzyme AslB (radical SAM superfamily)